MDKKTLKLFKRIPPLETERLVLRKISWRDKKDIFEYSKNEITSKYLFWSPHRDISDTKYYLRIVNRYYRHARFYEWAVVLKDSGKMIGTCGFVSFDEQNNNAEIGYVINPEYWNKGYACEAVKRVLEFGFSTLALSRIEGRFIIENTASKRVLEKCGMSFEGVLKSAILCKGERRDIGLCAITKE